MKRTIISLCLVLIMSSISYAKGWRGIVPLHSTCDDVKRLLDVTTCEASTYHLKDETVTIGFIEKPCLDGWSVPPGTVITLDVHPKPGLQLADLHIEENRYKKVTDPHLGGAVYYKDDEEGVSIMVLPGGSVGSFFYGPAAGDNYLRYPNLSADYRGTDRNSHGSIKFDEYGNIPFSDEKERLNNFAIQLQAEPKTQGYIIAYGGRRARVGEAKARADRARDYLVSTRGVESGRLVMVDGGYREELTVELFIRLNGGNAPIAFPTVCPNEVQIIKDSSARAVSRRSSRLRHK